ncbi:deoxyguanosinetriphosphate triphosphohydrolase [Rhodopseudomonas palustris]|uniref:Deoxyguanosinetriphosphate triphosphohydrolase-like protein n=1 Tax=Rhodopseudomonas palustris (strain ATCC BAA-98 / CGA009) TaxID=258594 RepID=Q6N5W5_RHOPA|nr:deoxyguanosinetriphosphate triphosphohydrolase [Rhodopseudomonas palustris]OPF89923.1 deoxyguanosinetriphosphate triphosphohydrolase [Rhodopseudomonas palustris]RJF65972.1 deoxyguanosinetriphosphate triphosphohydrolase [Rhodopseudomonas palustris]WAB75773.1 deoxyguanosinetriphosphate triphosphohydrolase [Rhodopseudomonas palustris]WCL93022.1 deoxyguanosinetriphosphate triphosphohydrolase [Rhodopseudomonas palustris CGA009]WND49682.1 deoxyguanosinetriphosphate triphosphohydrolase [Rhodopseud
MSVGMAAPRAAFGCDPDHSRGRQFHEPPSRTRSAFRRDCDRVIHSNAFRRLKHKTQVFVFHEGDHYRTRLTHSLEVAQIARALARQLGLDEDLTETLALAHDLGHPPFGHAGERALDACLKDAGGFDHNAQTLRVLTALEHRYPEFDGLNLTWETLEGVVKHNGPLTDRTGAPLPRYAEHGVPRGITEFNQRFDLQLWSFASLEAQVAAIADDIAYDAHDIDDGLRAGLFRIDDLIEVPLVARIIAAIDRRYPGLDDGRRGAELVRELISHFIGAVAAEAERRIAETKPASANDVRRAEQALVAFPAETAKAEAEIKAFLWTRMYRAERVMKVMRDAEAIVADLFQRYCDHPSDLPPDWLPANGPVAECEADRLLRIRNFIAGMTDRYALAEHQRLFDSTPDLR